MNYQETLDYIFHKLPMFSRMGSAAYKKDLTNTILLCKHLQHPEQKFKSIHIAGTNGKGSVSHMLAAIFQAAGYKTGLYTSPHLYDFRERIKINGQVVPETFVVDFVQTIKPLIEEIEPSFFEITVAMAFQYFAEQEVDIAIIEVGLGGRLDSTNVIRPELSLITNIGWDHMNLLGNSLEEIAAEKGGIIKENIPVVVGEKIKETKPVFEKIAIEKKAPLYLAADHFIVQSYALYPTTLYVKFGEDNGTSIQVETDLQGIYQIQNVRTVLAAVNVLKNQGWNLSTETTLSALKAVKISTGLGGRWEVIHQEPTVVLEVAHNENGIEKMLEHLAQLRFNQLHFVIGMVKDKEVEKILKHFPSTARYYFTQANIPRALPTKELQEKAALFHLEGNAYEEVNVALKAALEVAGKEDLILVCGSIFLVAEVDKSQYFISPKRSNA